MKETSPGARHWLWCWGSNAGTTYGEETLLLHLIEDALVSSGAGVEVGHENSCDTKMTAEIEKIFKV